MLPKFKSQCLSHMMPNLGGFIFLLEQGDNCAQFDRMDLEKNECTCCLLHEKGEILQNDIMWPLQLWG